MPVAVWRQRVGSPSVPANVCWISAAGVSLSGNGGADGLKAILDGTRSKTVSLRTSDGLVPDPFLIR